MAFLFAAQVPYLVALPLVFQTTEEWLGSELGVHPVQVALQVGSRGWLGREQARARMCAGSCRVRTSLQAARSLTRLTRLPPNLA